jgi:hypothetical protein
MILLPVFVRDCRTATRLIERRAAATLRPGERLRLWAHPRLCVYCRRYEAQSLLLARLAQQIPEPFTPATAAMKAQWQARITQALR